MIFVFALAAIIFWKVLRRYFQFVFDALTAIVKLLWGFWMRYWQHAADKAEGRAASQPQVAAVMNPAPVKRLLPMGWGTTHATTSEERGSKARNRWRGDNSEQ